MNAPIATYRLQLTPSFGFAAATAIVPYLSSLGITHLYLSPVLTAAPGSTHGYDVVDPTTLRAELGGESAFLDLAKAAHDRGMGLLVDFVPNHLGVATADNVYWNEVLENGPASVCAEHFDIDWAPPKESLARKLLLPILGEQYGLALEGGKIDLVRDGGRFFLTYGGRRLPVAPRTLRPLLDDALTRLELPRDHDACLEFESIRTAIEHLPPIDDESDRARRAARAREKDVIKRRLATLVRAESAVERALDDAVKALRGTPGDGQSYDAFDAFVRAQPYRLASYRVASEAINYRRFFDVNELAAIRMEHPPVFALMHRLLFRLVREGHVDGIRLDHTDGLYDPTGYFHELARGLAEARGEEEPPSSRSEPKPVPKVYTVAEKILGPDETIPDEWCIHGTTGYDFVAQAIGVLIDPDGAAALTDNYRSFTGDVLSYDEHVRAAKVHVMHRILASEMHMLARQLERIAEARRESRDFTVMSLETALRETVAAFSIYRTYVRPDGRRAPSDEAQVRRAVRLARRRNPTVDGSVFAFIEKVLLLEAPYDDADAVELAMKVQQTTGPVMAKSVEDTVFFRYPRLLAENEVGCHPGRVGVPVDEFHRLNRRRRERSPWSMTTTATHDTKLGEDARARIALFSEMPHDFRRTMERWSALAKAYRSDIDGESAPSAIDEYRFLQALFGIHPVSATTPRAALTERLVEYAIKSAREAKTFSSWLDPDLAYEGALESFIVGAMGDEAFLADVRALVAATAPHAASNGLAQLVLKLAAPGVPDVYQGTERWQHALVEPDNRRAVDFEELRRNLETVRRPRTTASALAEELLASFADGRIKTFVLHRGLAARGRLPRVFLDGAYEPLDGGPHVVAFARRHEGSTVVCCVPRLVHRLTGGEPRFALGDAWAGTRLRGAALPEGLALTDVFTERRLETKDGIALARVFDAFPVALLTTG